ncbi:hypothetical protein DPMN_007972 [Dreissena polymorpha]|uniref:Uncharacterized protein n=1 Tax=Dreissena polymorpha TaxID=45954 RepID=A0A9D4MU95_DREPO|nr:hypothetical protein DPMN_007972 [Dreissena polymorpha]
MCIETVVQTLTQVTGEWPVYRALNNYRDICQDSYYSDRRMAGIHGFVYGDSFPDTYHSDRRMSSKQDYTYGDNCPNVY